MRTLFALDCPQWLKVAFLLCGFAGLRTEELLRMDWKALLHDEQSIHVARGIQKDSGGWTERYVDSGVTMTSLSAETNRNLTPPEVAEVAKSLFLHRLQDLPKKLF